MKSPQTHLIITLLLPLLCASESHAAAQNYSVDIGAIIFRDDATWRIDSVATDVEETVFFLADNPGAVSPGGDLEARKIPGGDNALDVYPDFGGVQAYSNDRGSFRAHLASGVSAGPGVKVENQVLLIWTGDFIKSADGEPFKFHVNPGLLRLVDGRGTPHISNPDLEASWRLTAKVEGITQFDTYKRLHGHGSFTSQIRAVANGEFKSYYEMTEDTDPIPGELKSLLEVFSTPDGTRYSFIGGQYKTPAFTGTLDLDGINPGEVFNVTYELSAHTVAYGPDTVAESMSGDPLKYAGGVITEYGDYGELLRITDFTIDGQGQSHVQYPSDPDYYYILCSGEEVTGIEPPLAMKNGEDGVGELLDNRAADQQQRAFYLVKRVHRTVPLDSDGDGIDDIYELDRPAILNPLNASDALADTDEDGRNARQEYLEGTDPEVQDEGPTSRGPYPAAAFAVGNGSDLETADLNNDGVADLINFSASLFVSMGNQDGTFAPPSTVAIPDAGFFGDITLGKLNADDFPDVVFADEGNNRVEILLGDGIGGFTSNAKHDLGVAPRRAVLAMVNNDAHLDIITANNVARSVSVLLGNGDGTFQAPVNVDTEVRPTDATTALMNDDEHPDLVVTLETGGSFAAVFLNNGDGTFAPKVTYPTGFSPQRVATGDVNNDTFQDVITSNKTGDGVSVLLGNGDGTLQGAVDYPTGDNPRGFLVTDLDGDTDPDLLVAHSGANHHSLLLNDGAGVFAENGPAFTSSGNENCLLVDVDRDGQRDIISRVNFGGSRAMISYGLAGGGFETRDQFNFPVGQFTPRDLEIADVNGDGRQDVLISNAGNQNTVEILAGASGGGFNLLTPVPIGENVEGLALARLNLGLTLDLAVVTQRPDSFPGNSSNRLYVLTGNGIGGFSEEQIVELHAQPKEVLAGDFDGDGSADLLVAYNTTGELQLFVQTPTGLDARTPVNLGQTFGGSASTRVVADFNGDQIDDVAAVVYAGGPGMIKILPGNNSGILVESQSITPLANGSAQKLAVGDVNGDGRLDLLATLAGAGISKLVYYPGSLDGSLGPEQLFLDDYSGSIAFADINSDGLTDLLDGSNIRLALESGGFSAPTFYYVGATTLPFLIADMNGDGRPDLIAADDSGDAVEILLHR